MLKTVERVLRLQDIEFLAGTPTESLVRLAVASTYEDVPAGATLFELGESPDELIFVVAGEVKLTNQEGCSSTVELTGLDFLSVLAEVPHIVTARAATSCSVLRVSLDNLVELLSSDAEFSWRILKYVAALGRSTCFGDPVPEYPRLASKK